MMNFGDGESQMVEFSPALRFLSARAERTRAALGARAR